MIKKIISVVVSFFLIHSFIIYDIIFSMPSAPVYNIQKVAAAGKITDSFIKAGGNPKIIFIQDLHSSISVQENIAKIISSLSKNFNVDKILIEGAPFVKIDTSFIKQIEKFNLSEALLKKGLLSGTEYYLTTNDKNNINLFGLEQWNIYLKNIKRAALLMKDMNYMLQLYDNFKDLLYSKIPNADKYIQYVNFGFNDTDIISEMNQPILKYREFQRYWQLLDIADKINLKKLDKEFTSFTKELRGKLSVAEYKNIVLLSNKKESSEYYDKLLKYLLMRDKYETDYKNLYLFLNYSKSKANINLFSLLEQKNEYLNDFISSGYINNMVKDYLFIIKMTEILKSFKNLTITEKDYLFFKDNYERYINLISKILAEDFIYYDDLFLNIDTFDYHETNIKRNEIFTENILKAVNSNKYSSDVNIVIAGGFHSSILSELKNNNIEYVLITPTVENDVDDKMYRNIMASADDDIFSTQALAKISMLLINDKSLNIPEKTVSKYMSFLIEEISKTDSSPAAVGKIIEQLAKSIPISSAVKGNVFIISINGKEQLSFNIEDNTIIWDKSLNIELDHTESEDKKSGSFVSFIKKKFNVFETSSMRLNPESEYYSKFMSVRTGKRKNVWFTFAAILSFLHQYQKSYETMTGSFLRSIKDDVTEITIEFNGKKLQVYIENELLEYISKEDLIEFFNLAEARLEQNSAYDKDVIVIGLLSKSTNLFEDHLNNGFIGVNEGILGIKDANVKKAIIRAGLIHEISHELKGTFNDKTDFLNFEDKMMFADAKDIIEFLASAERNDGTKVNIKDIHYDEYDRLVKKIISVIAAEDAGSIPLMDKNVRFIRKLINYKYNIEDMISFLKRKDFTDTERKGQLEHIEKIYLVNNPVAQREIFSNLVNKHDDDSVSMDEFLLNTVPERKHEVDARIAALIKKIRNILSAVNEQNPVFVDNICNEFETCIRDGLELMYKKMPKYMFLSFYDEKTVIPDHALKHSIETLNMAIWILARDPNIKESIEKLDIRALVYAALMHDVSCTLFRINHEENSAIFAEDILRDSLSEQRVEKIVTICRGHKKPKNGPREEHKIPEAALFCDADGFSAALRLDRILGVWVSARETIFNQSLLTEDRLRLIRENKYLMHDGGDALNDLLRQFARRKPDLYLTPGAKEIISTSRNPQIIIDFLNSQREFLKNSNMNVSDSTVDIMIRTMKSVLQELFPEYYGTETDSDVKQDENMFTLGKKISLLGKYIKLFGQYITKNILNSKLIKTFYKKVFVIKDIFNENIVFSDIHGGYGRLTELIAGLLDSTLDTSSMTGEELEDIVMNRLSSPENKSFFYILGDMLDRGDRQVDGFRFIKKLFEKHKAKYVMGNHDIYSFMNLIGLHLPYYKGYKGISDSYTVILDYENGQSKEIKVKQLLEEQQKNNKENAADKTFWAKILSDYMSWAEKQQTEKWTKKEPYLQEAFFEEFGERLDKDGKDILNNPSGIFAEDSVLLNFHKKFFGRNVGIAVYTGIRAASKMSVNWWVDRKQELAVLKEKYPQHKKYWDTLNAVIEEILSDVKTKVRQQYDSGNWYWLVIDSIMYRNYESTEWNALDWAYHNKWGGGKEGFIAQRNKEIIRENETIEAEAQAAEQAGDKQKARRLREKKSMEIDTASYFGDSLMKELMNFFKNNFYLYRRDEYGIYYMHSLLPVDDEGDVSIGYVDDNGVFREIDSKTGKRIKGFKYKGTHYHGKNLFKGLERIAEDVRNFNLDENGTGDLSKIHEALTLITAVYADNTTRVKPVNMREMRSFGLGKILRKLGVTTIVVGHNPVSKLDAAFEYTTYASLFNGENKIVNVVQVDGSMSPGYAKPKGAGLVRIIGNGIRTRGFATGTSTQITSNVAPDVDTHTFMISTLINIFPFVRSIIKLEAKIAAKINEIREDYKSDRISKRNTLVVGIVNSQNELDRYESFINENAHCMPLIINEDIINNMNTIDGRIIDSFEVSSSYGEKIIVSLVLNNIKLAKKQMRGISVVFNKNVDEAAKAELTKEVLAHISEKITSDEVVPEYRIFSEFKNIAFITSEYGEHFERLSTNISDKMQEALTLNFGILPVIFDIRKKKEALRTEDITKQLSLERIQNMLSAA